VLGGHSLRLACLAALLTASGIASPAAEATAVTPAEYSRAVIRICGHALLFEGRHQIGTRTGAVEVAGDIRSSTGRRLTLVAALTTPAAEQRAVGRWMVLERRLADVFADDYLGIFDLIDAPDRPERALLVARLLHAPDPLRQAAARVEQQLHVPGCTGG
jgi:hypothetical protein